MLCGKLLSDDGVSVRVSVALPAVEALALPLIVMPVTVFVSPASTSWSLVSTLPVAREPVVSRVAEYWLRLLSAKRDSLATLKSGAASGVSFSPLIVTVKVSESVKPLLASTR